MLRLDFLDFKKFNFSIDWKNLSTQLQIKNKGKNMAKKVMDYIKLQIEAGKANPAPPVGPALGQRGVNIMEFWKAFNEKTKDKMGFKVPVVITVYTDRSFSFITKQPPASALLMKAAGLKKGTDNPLKIKLEKSLKLN